VSTDALDWCGTNEYTIILLSSKTGKKQFRGTATCVGGDIQEYEIKGSTKADSANVQNNWGQSDDLDDEVIKGVVFYNGLVSMDFIHDTTGENEIQITRLDVSPAFIREEIQRAIAKKVSADTEGNDDESSSETGMVKIDITSYVKKLQDQSYAKANDSKEYAALANAVVGMLTSEGASENFTAFVNSSIMVCDDSQTECNYGIELEVTSGKVYIKAYGLELNKKYALVIDTDLPYPNFKPKKATFEVDSFDKE